MAIHIDIYAHLRNREVIKEGERLLQLIDHYEREANRRARRGAQGRSKQIVAAQDKVDTAYDGTINKIDSYIAATRRLEDARESLASVENRTIRTEEDAQQQTEDLARARQELAFATKDLVYKGQQLNRAVRDETRARKDLNDESKKHTKNAAAVTRITKQNKREFANLAGATTKARNEILSLNNANQVHVKDNEKVTRGLRALNKATKNTARERKKYKDLLKTEGVTAKQLEAQTLRIRDAFEAESYAIQDLRSTITQAIGESKKFNTQQARAMAMLGAYNSGLQDNDDLLKREIANNGRIISSTRGTQRVFDQATDAVGNYRTEHDKLVKMIGDSSVSSSALESQIDRTSKSYVNMERRVRDATKTLREQLIEEAKMAARSPFGRGRGRRDLPDIEGSLARNLGALTPLGTVTPGLLIPLGAGFFAVAQGAVAASQSVALLPSALSAAAVGFGVLQMATMGLSDSFGAMMDFNNPDKFAESLRLMSPAAQQFMLSIQQLIPTFMELKNAVQDTFFAGLPQVVNGLAKTYRDAFGSMSVGVSAAFNGIFQEIGTVLQNPATQQSLAVMFHEIVKSFQGLIPLAGSLTQIFVQLSSVGSGVFTSVVDDVAKLTQNFSDFIDKAAASGDLKKWMEEGWQALKALGQTIVYAGKMLYDVFGLHGPRDIERFKTTMFGLIDGFGVFLGTLEKFFYGLSVLIREISDSPIGAVLDLITDKIGGLETALALLAGGLFTVKLGAFVWKWKNLIGDAVSWGLMKIGLVRSAAAALPATVAAAGTAAGAAGGAAAGAGLTAAGAAAGAGFAAKAANAIKSFSWGAVGLAIAIPIMAELDKAIYNHFKKPGDPGIGEPGGPQERLIPVGIPILPFWEDVIRKLTGNELGTVPAAPPMGGGGDFPSPDGTMMGSDGKPYRPVDRGTPGAVPIPGKNQWGLPGAGSPLSGSRDPGSGWGAIPDLPFGGFPVPTPNPGGGPTPNIPYGQYSLDSIPLGQFGGAQWTAPDPRSMVSQLTPHQIQQGRTKGYGYVVDPQQVFDKESALQRQRAAVEEARARVLELQADNQATEQAKIAAQANIVEAERSFIKTQVELLEAQRGTWKKVNESLKDQANILDGLGAEIDADFGISKGLPGIAENIVKFLANITAAPLYGQLAAQRAAGGDLGGAKGLVGMAALSGLFGPQFMQPEITMDPQSGVVVPNGTVIVPNGTTVGGTPAVPPNPGGGTGTGSTGAGAPLGGPGLYPSPGQGMPMRWNLPIGMGYPGDAAILSQIPKGIGRYDSVTKDLTKGLVDCASGVEDLVNIIDGKSTAGGSLATGTAASVLPGMGFQRGKGGPGDFRIGYNSGHMEATLPDGTPVNFGSTASIQSGGVAGAVGANSPYFTDFWYRPMSGPGGSPALGPTGRYPSPGQGMPMPWRLPPLTPGGGAGIGDPGPVTPGGTGGYAPLSPSELTGTGLTNPMPLAPGGYSAPGAGPSQIGAVVGPPEGTGSGFGGLGGGLLGAVQGAVGAAAAAAGAMGTMGGGGPAASAAAQIGIEELNRAIAFAGQAAGIGVSGLMETFLPTGGSDLANNNWFTRLVGGVVGMRPLLPNFANISGAAAGVQNGQDSGGNVQGGPVSVTQNNFNPTGNSTTDDLSRLGQQAAAASMPAMGAGR